jgi:hypothetical protein
MGKQQLLLLTVGAIIVAIAVAIGIRVLSESSAQANLEAVIFDIQALAARGISTISNPRVWAAAIVPLLA